MQGEGVEKKQKKLYSGRASSDWYKDLGCKASNRLPEQQITPGSKAPKSTLRVGVQKEVRNGRNRH